MAVDDGFLYAVQDGSAPPIGAVVRVPLGARTVRGVVTATGQGDDDGLKPIKSVSPALPLFDEVHLGLLRWLGRHYVAPLSAVLRMPAPPNLPRPSLTEPTQQEAGNSIPRICHRRNLD